MDECGPEDDDKQQWLDPLDLTRKQWERICTNENKIAKYSCCVDRRWPGYMQQPWFTSAQEINEALHEKRITLGHGQLCKRLLRNYGECLNRTAKKFLEADQWLVKGVNCRDPTIVPTKEDELAPGIEGDDEAQTPDRTKWKNLQMRGDSMRPMRGNMQGPVTPWNEMIAAVELAKAQTKETEMAPEPSSPGSKIDDDEDGKGQVA
jgi:hypothetical protein